MFSYVVRGFLGRSALQKMLRSHFAGASLAELATASRTFPITARVDLQTAVDELLTRRDETRLVGVHSQMNHETPTFAHLFTPGPFLFDLGPLQQDEIDIGEEGAGAVPQERAVARAPGRDAVCGPVTPSLARGRAMGVHVASRPGRVDQAIEFPLPNDEGRMKLATLYARGVAVPPSFNSSSAVAPSCQRLRSTVRSKRWCSPVDR